MRKNIFSSRIFLVSLSAISLALSFPGPFEFWFLAWVGLVPLFFLFYNQRTIRETILFGFLFGVLFYGFVGAWFIATGPYQRAGWSILFFIWGLTHFVPLFLSIWWVRRYLGTQWVLVNVVSLWILADWLIRESLFKNPGFNIAESQYNILPLLQIIDIGGIYAVTLLILLVNAALFLLIRYRGQWRRMERIEQGIIVAACVLLVLTSVYGFTKDKDSAEKQTRPFSFVAIQPGFRYENETNVWGNAERLEKLITLSENALSPQEETPNILLWPETVLPSFILGETDDPKTLRIMDEAKTKTIIDFYERTGKIPLMFGTYIVSRTYPTVPTLFFNSMVFLSGNTFNWYNKTAPLFLAESAPDGLVRLLRRLSSHFNLQLGQKLSGERLVPFFTNNIQIGTMICSENGISHVARQHTKNGADILINPMDASSIDSAWEIRHQAVLNKFRAIENRRWVISVSTIGPTQLISPHGDVIKNLPLFDPGWLRETIHLEENPPQTFYTRFGQFFLWSALLFVVLELCAFTLVAVRKRAS